jgi:hypothetical protein
MKKCKDRFVILYNSDQIDHDRKVWQKSWKWIVTILGLIYIGLIIIIVNG